MPEPSVFEVEYARRPQGARITLANHLLSQMKEAQVPPQNGIELLELCRRAAQHTSGHAIDFHRRTNGTAVDSDIAITRGGLTSDLARKKEPFVRIEQPQAIHKQKI